MTKHNGEWYVYVLRCRDNTLYCGISNDVAKRVEAHTKGLGAKYTRGRGPFAVVARWACPSKADALKAEIAFKRLSKERKLRYLTGLESTWSRA